jgi:hypothetical protein
LVYPNPNPNPKTNPNPKSYINEVVYINIINTNIIIIEITLEKLIGLLRYDKTSQESKNEIMHLIFGAFQDRTKYV